MNDRIKELRNRAQKWVLDIPTSLSPAEFDDMFEEKFAELIVRECMEVVEKQYGGGNGDGVEWDRAIDFTYEDMKKHFGVGK